MPPAAWLMARSIPARLSEPWSGFSSNNTNVGWTVGAGVEGVIGGNWTAKLEYLYVDLGRTSGSFATTIPAFGAGLVPSGTLTSSYSRASPTTCCGSA